MIARQWIVVWLGLLVGCEAGGPAPSKEPPVPTAPAMPAATGSVSKPEQSGTVTDAPKEKVFQGIKVTIPAGWEEKAPANEFIQAEYGIAAPEGKIRVTMSSAGGGKEANVERWRGQFTRGADDPEPVQETVLIDGQEAILVELFGTFRDGFGGGGEQRNWCMFGAVIPTGPVNFFVKMTGPREAVTAQRNAFRDLVTNAKLGD
jgi:hypothetical protein